MKKILFVSAALAAALALAPAAMATQLYYNIDFSCADGSGVSTSSAALCTGSTPNETAPTAIASWTEGVFSVSTTGSVPGSGHGGAGGTWFYNPNQGNPKPNLTGFASANLPNETSPTSGEEVIVNDATLSTFVFDSIDIDGGSTVTVVGRTAAGLGVFRFTALDPGPGYITVLGSAFSTSGTPDNFLAISYLQIDFSGGGINYLDNIDVTLTPEPDSLIMLGTGFGLLGLGLFLRRKHTAAARSTTTQPTVA